MRHYLLFFSLLALAACYEEPEFPDEPRIDFESVRFVESTSPTSPEDTLKITVSFKDGDGDLGIIPPGQHFYDSVFNGKYIRYRELEGTSNDTLPALNCSNYRTGYFNNNGGFVASGERTKITDTIYVRPNPLYYNFFIQLYTVKNGQAKEFDFVEFNYPSCGISPNGRFRLNNSNQNKALSGTITYNFNSQFLLPFFSDDSLKLRVRIADRSGNLSNWADSDVFTLRGVQTNR